MPVTILSPSAKAADILSRLSKEQAISHCEIMIDACIEQLGIAVLMKDYATERVTYWQQVLDNVLKSK